VGTIYHLATTFDQGSQVVWVNGRSTGIASITGATQSSSANFQIGGWDYSPGAGSIWSIDDVAVWNGYVLTATDVINLRNGTQTPPQIGGSATWRGRWTLGGTTGTVPRAGDAGLANNYGDATYNLTGISGSGSALYADPLVWAAAARIKTAYIGTSGKTCVFMFKSIGSGQDIFAQTSLTPPTITKNGVCLGQLINPWVTGVHKSVMYGLPAGTSVVPGDSVTIDAPVSWMITSAGDAEAVSGLAIGNNAGKSCFGTDTLTKTLKLGMNIEGGYAAANGSLAVLKNWRYRCGAFSGATMDAGGKPLTLTLHNYAGTPIYSNNDINGIDATGMPGPTGLFAVGWDDLNPSNPTGWVLEAWDTAATTTITERTDLANPGAIDSSGARRGIVKVFNVQRAAGSTVARTEFSLAVTNATMTPQFDNVVVYGPGDFTYSSNTPTVLDKSDPYALSATFLDRLANGAGSVRSWTPLLGGANSTLSEPEDIRTSSDFCWGFMQDKSGVTVRYTGAYPFSQTDTPYFYDPNQGSKFNATLAAAIPDTTSTSLTISNAATAPVIVGLRLYVDNEIMRVKAVSGTTVTVERGSEGSTPATHSAGTIQVGCRVAMPALSAFASGQVIRYEGNAPHGLKSGTVMTFSGTWPSFTGLFTNGANDNQGNYMWNYSGPCFVTSPTGFLVQAGPNGTGVGTLTAAQTLTPTAQTSYVGVPNGNPQVPYEAISSMASRVVGADFFCNVPHLATNALVDKIARTVRDNFGPGRSVYVELSCETWNFIPGVYFRALSAVLYPGQDPYVAYAKRSADIWQRFRDRFNEGGRNRGGEIKGILNIQSTAPGVASDLLTWAAAQSPPIQVGAIAIAPYINYSDYSDSVTNAVYANYDADQSVDLYIHNLYHQNPATTLMGRWQAFSTAIANYNAATGFNCQLVGYEGDLELAIPNQSSGNAANNKARDFYYSPAYYIAQQDFYALIQSNGFARFNLFHQCGDFYQGKYLWPDYTWPFQPHGRGDGSDNKADNRQCLAQTKSATVNQDLQNVSVRGQAFLDWMGAMIPPRKRRLFLPHSSSRVRN
jgi:hypothetical protein